LGIKGTPWFLLNLLEALKGGIFMSLCGCHVEFGTPWFLRKFVELNSLGHKNQRFLAFKFH